MPTAFPKPVFYALDKCTQVSEKLQLIMYSDVVLDLTVTVSIFGKKKHLKTTQVFSSCYHIA